MINVRKPNAIILDIEGTTTSPKFVSEVLFPFIKQNLKKYLRENWKKTELKITIDKLREQQAKERDQPKNKHMPLIIEELEDESNREAVIKTVVANVLWQMDEKKKSSALKQMQILVWIYGYELGYIKGHIYDDVAGCLHTWKNDLNIKLYIYSTGMIVAQQLLFSCSTFGNLLPLFDGYYDILTGSKLDSASYSYIANEIKEEPQNILFLNDSPKEAKAASLAGLAVILVRRPENKALAESELRTFTCINSFEDINFV